MGGREQQAYRAGVGNLNRMTIFNRPDLAFAVLKLVRHLATPTALHTTALVHTPKYAVMTRHFVLRYRRQPFINPAICTAEVSTFVSHNRVVCFYDAGFANAIDTHKPHTGCVSIPSNAAINWKSFMQRLVASSFTKSEYLALSYCVKQTEYMRHILAFLDQAQTTPTSVLEDNAS